MPACRANIESRLSCKPWAEIVRLFGARNVLPRDFDERLWTVGFLNGVNG